MSESNVKRVSMVVDKDHPGVFDGLGGVHKHGSHPVLPADVADAFIAAKLAVPFSAGTEEQEAAKRELGAVLTQRRAEAYKPHAEAIMQNHDNLTAEQRQAAYYRNQPSVARVSAAPVAEDDDEWLDDDSSIETPNPEQQPGSSTPMMDLNSTPNKTPSPSLTTTSPSPPTKPTGAPAVTSGSKRRSR